MQKKQKSLQDFNKQEGFKSMLLVSYAQQKKQAAHTALAALSKILTSRILKKGHAVCF